MNSQLSKILLVLITQLMGSCGFEVKEGVHNIFHYNQPNPVTSLDPAFAKSQNNIWAVDHIFNQLVDLDSQMQIKPELAKSWEISQDGLNYTFHLRTDVFFHTAPDLWASSSRKFVARDVEYSFLRLMDPNLNAPGSWVLMNKLDDRNPFQLINDSTLVIRLKSAFSPFLSLLTMQYCSIVPKEAVEHYGNNFARNPVGTGPFSLKNWLDRQGIFLERNNRYFRSGQPELEGVRISFIEDRNTAFLEFMNKGIDFFSGVQASFAAQLLTNSGELRSELKDKFGFVRANYLNTEYIGINLESLSKDDPLHSVHFRQALNYAIDREQMISLFRFGLGVPAVSGFIPSALVPEEVKRPKCYTYDPEKAKDLIRQSGYGMLPSEQKTIVVNTNKDYLDLVSFIVRQWQEVGVMVKIELMETASLREKMRNGSLDFFRASWIADYPDPESFMAVFYSKNPPPPNYTRFRHQGFDSLYERAVLETDPLIRANLYVEMDQIICNEAPVIFLLYDEVALFHQTHVKGIHGNAINLLKLEGVRE